MIASGEKTIDKEVWCWLQKHISFNLHSPCSGNKQFPGGSKLLHFRWNLHSNIKPLFTAWSSAEFPFLVEVCKHCQTSNRLHPKMLILNPNTVCPDYFRLVEGLLLHCLEKVTKHPRLSGWLKIVITLGSANAVQKLHLSQPLNQHAYIWAVKSTAQWADSFSECISLLSTYPRSLRFRKIFHGYFGAPEDAHGLVFLFMYK